MKKMRKVYLEGLTIATVFCIIAGSIVHLGRDRRNVDYVSAEPEMAADYGSEIYQDFERLYVSIDAGWVDIDSGDTFAISWDKDVPVDWRILDGNLYVESYETEPENAPHINLTIPYNQCSEAELSARLGKVSVNGLSVNSMRIDCGVGDISVQAGEVSTACLNAGIGDVTLDGVVFDDMTIDCSTGNADILLPEPALGYAMELSTNLGTITVGDEVRGRANGQYSQQADDGSTLWVYCGTGDILVR